MTTTMDSTAQTPIRKRITVKTSVAHAFKLFTDGFDTWWPRSHHIGKSPMKRAIIEGKPGGRCYTEEIERSGDSLHARGRRHDARRSRASKLYAERVDQERQERQA
jgi:hypothetical protein